MRLRGLFDFHRFLTWRFINSVILLLSLKKAASRAPLLANMSLSLRLVSKSKSWKRKWNNGYSIDCRARSLSPKQANASLTMHGRFSLKLPRPVVASTI